MCTYTDVIDDYNADDGDSNGDHGDDDSDDNGSGNDDDGGDNNADYDDHNDDPDKGNNKNVPGVVLAAALLCTLLLSFAIIFTMIVFIWWKLQTNSEWLLNTIESTIDTNINFVVIIIAASVCLIAVCSAFWF